MADAVCARKDETEMKIGFIGLGTMGCPMAEHLLDGGHELCTHARRTVPQSLLAKGIYDSGSYKEVAKRSDTVITMLPDTPDVDAVLFGPDGVATGLDAGKLVVDMSSISPIATKQFSQKIRELGCDYLDAPVSGGEVGAKQATLTIMVGGTEDAFARAKPLFDLMGKAVSLVGNNGDGQTAKVANQIIVALTIEAVGEALLFASKAGADPAKVRRALMGGFASSRVLEVHGERMINRTFTPGFRIELHRKDLNLALSGAQTLEMSLPNTAACQELFNACMARGDQNSDHSALVKVLEELANHQISSEMATNAKA
jgi:2-hydroxy-3-oxopropionate reductase